MIDDGNGRGSPRWRDVSRNFDAGLDRRTFLAAAGTSVTAGFAGCGGLIDSGVSEDGLVPAVLRWNARYVDAVQSFQGGNIGPTRRCSILNVAMYDAVNAITAANGDPHYEPYHVDVEDAPRDASRAAAASGAAQHVLSYFYPDDFRGLYDEIVEQASDDGGDVDSGESWGQTVADRIIDLRSEDGEYETGVYVACPDEPNGAGCFRRSWTPIRAQVEPWAMDSADQFRPGPPPAMDSQEYAEDWQEVYEKGDDRADRPQEHVDIAEFWRGAPGSPRPPNMWNVVARKLAEDAEDRSLLEDARLFATLNVALADGGIATSDGKAHHGHWRPDTAIAEADADGNPETSADEGWTPLAVGGSPEYPAGLALFGGVGGEILTEEFGDDVSFELGGDINTGIHGETHGVTRSFDSVSAAVQESLDSRIYVGNHFRFSLDTGRTTGNEIAAWVRDNYFQPVE